MPGSYPEIARVLADVAQHFAGEDSLATVAQDVQSHAVHVVPGCDYAAVSLAAPRRRIVTPALSAEVADLCGEAQHRLGEGPSLDIIAADGSVMLVDDTLTEHRWPRFCRQAAEAGVRSLVVQWLGSPERTLGALELYSCDPDGFAHNALEVAVMYASHASLALASMEREEHLRRAIRSRETIATAIGILSERHALTSQQAFDLLARASQEHNIKVRDLAYHLVQTRAQIDEVRKSDIHLRGPEHA